MNNTHEISECVLEHKICTGCGKCNFCDLDEGKICDNCMKCLKEDDQDFKAIEVTEVRYE
jgi:hypothetical protein